MIYSKPVTLTLEGFTRDCVLEYVFAGSPEHPSEDYSVEDQIKIIFLDL